MNKKFFAAAALAAFTLTGVGAHAALSDGQILQVVMTADQSQIDAGTGGRYMAVDPEVKNYAEKSILDFSNHLMESEKLQASAKINLADSDENKTLKAETEKSLEDLKNQKAADFDKAYIDSQVSILQKFMDGMDKTLIPDAQNADLKVFLQEARIALEGHLNDAKALQAKMNPAPQP